MGSILLVGAPGTGKTRLILKYVKMFDKVLWVCTTESANSVRKKLGDFKGDLWVVDTHTWDQNISTTPKDLIVKNPLNLNEVSIAITKALDNLKRDYLIVFDSISGLLLYNPAPKVIHFLRNLVVRMDKENGSGIFTIVEGSHDLQTQTQITLIFNEIIHLVREFDGDEVKRFIKIFRSSEYLEKEVAELKIVKDDVVLPKELDRYIRLKLGLKA